MNKVLTTLGTTVVGGIGVAIGGTPQHSEKLKRKPVEKGRSWSNQSGENIPYLNRTKFTGRGGNTSASW